MLARAPQGGLWREKSGGGRGRESSYPQPMQVGDSALCQSGVVYAYPSLESNGTDEVKERQGCANPLTSATILGKIYESLVKSFQAIPASRWVRDLKNPRAWEQKEPRYLRPVYAQPLIFLKLVEGRRTGVRTWKIQQNFRGRKIRKSESLSIREIYANFPKNFYSMLEKIRAADIIAFTLIIGAFVLKLRGADGTTTATIALVAAYYFGKQGNRPIL